MKKFLFIFSLVVSMVLGVTSCTEEPEVTTGNIAGMVTSASYDIDRLEGVTVTLTELGHSQITDEFGLYVFENIAPGVYTLQFRKSGYVTETRTVTVFRGEVSGCDLTMTPIETTELLSLSDNKLTFEKHITERTFSIYNVGNSGTVDWEISGITVDWLTVAPIYGSTAQGHSSAVKVIVDHSKISTAYGYTTIYVNGNGFSIPLSIEVSNISGSGNGGSGDNGGNGGNGGGSNPATEDYSSAEITCDLPDVDIALISCRRKSGNLVELTYTMTNTDMLHNQGVTINNVNAFTGHTQIADNLGNQYPKDQVKISLAGKDFGFGNNIEGTLLGGVPAKVVVTVKAVDADATKMYYYLYTSTAKPGGVNYTSDIVFKNVPIY